MSLSTGVVKQGWVSCTLKDISLPIRPRRKPSDLPQLPFIGMQHVEAHSRTILGTVPAATMKSSAVHFQRGDVLYGRLRPYLNKVVRPDYEGLCSAEFIVFEDKQELISKFLLYRLSASDFVAFASSLNTGDRPRVDFDQISAFRMTLPPTAEQHRIVEAIEALFSRLDAAVAALKRVQANLKRYRASVLKAACEGRLVPTEAELARKEGRNFESADKLLARILIERRKRWEETEWAKHIEKAKQKAAKQARKEAGNPLKKGEKLKQEEWQDLHEVDYKLYVPKGDKWREKYKTESAPLEGYEIIIPHGWCRASMGALTELKGGITVDQKRALRSDVSEVPYLRVANVQRGELILKEVKNVHATPRQVEDLTLCYGDILLNEGGDRDKLGRGWIWEAQLPLCIHQNHVFRARPLVSELSSKFLSHYANSAAQDYFFDEGKQTTNLASISLSRLACLPIPLPPAEEQKRIVAEIDRILSVTDEVDQTIILNLKRAERLRQSILKRAFEGRLVPTEAELAAAENRGFETAEQLLKRIKASQPEPTKKLTRKKKAHTSK